jgi:hypothetical protein
MGAMAKLISDSTQVEISNRVNDLLQALIINDWLTISLCETTSKLAH